MIENDCSKWLRWLKLLMFVTILFYFLFKKKLLYLLYYMIILRLNYEWIQKWGCVKPMALTPHFFSHQQLIIFYLLWWIVMLMKFELSSFQPQPKAFTILPPTHVITNFLLQNIYTYIFLEHFTLLPYYKWNNFIVKLIRHVHL